MDRRLPWLGAVALAQSRKRAALSGVLHELTMQQGFISAQIVVEIPARRRELRQRLFPRARRDVAPHGRSSCTSPRHAPGPGPSYQTTSSATSSAYAWKSLRLPLAQWTTPEFAHDDERALAGRSVDALMFAVPHLSQCLRVQNEVGRLGPTAGSRPGVACWS